MYQYKKIATDGKMSMQQLADSISNQAPCTFKRKEIDGSQGIMYIYIIYT